MHNVPERQGVRLVGENRICESGAARHQRNQQERQRTDAEAQRAVCGRNCEGNALTRPSEFSYDLPGFSHSFFVVPRAYEDFLVSHLHAFLDALFRQK
jgi:hypothetical protein